MRLPVPTYTSIVQATEKATTQEKAAVLKALNVAPATAYAAYSISAATVPITAVNRDSVIATEIAKAAGVPVTPVKPILPSPPIAPVAPTWKEAGMTGEFGVPPAWVIAETRTYSGWSIASAEFWGKMLGLGRYAHCSEYQAYSAKKVLRHPQYRRRRHR